MYSYLVVVPNCLNEFFVQKSVKKLYEYKNSPSLFLYFVDDFCGCAANLPQKMKNC